MPLPQDAVGAVVLLLPVDLPVPMAAAGPGDGFLRDLVGRTLERPDLLLLEDAADREHAVAVELRDLVGAEHRSLLAEVIPTLLGRACRGPEPTERAASDEHGYDSDLDSTGATDE